MHLWIVCASVDLSHTFVGRFYTVFTPLVQLLLVTNDRSEARVDPLAALIVQGQNRQISSRGIVSNVDKTESKSEAEQWVRAGGRQRGLPVHRRGQRGRQQTIRRGSQQSR